MSYKINSFTGRMDNVGVPSINMTRVPTTNDYKFPAGQQWVDTDGGGIYFLADVTASVATWEKVAGGSAGVSQLTADSGSATPAAGAITIAGGVAITTSGAGSTITINASDASAIAKGVASFDATDFTVTAGDVALNKVVIAKGGTNSVAALANDLIMISAAGAIVEGGPTVAELETLTDGSDASSLHIHDARYYTETELGVTTSGSAGCSLIGAPAIGTPTYTTACDRMSLFNSAGRCTGGAVTDAGSENLSIALGTGFIKATDSDVAELLSFDWITNASVATTTDTHQHTGVIYNGGAPIVDIRATDNYDLDTEFPLASIVNEGGSLHILNNPWWVTDGITNIIERFNADGYIVRDKKVGGLVTTVPGTRNLAVTAGTLWSNLNEFAIPAIDTNTAVVASHSATFDVDNGASKGTITAGSGTPYTVLSASQYVAITGTGDNDGTYKIESIAGGNVITMTTVIAGTDGVEAATVINSTFEYYSYNGVAGTWSDSHETQYSVTQWNDTTLAALQTIDNNKYVNMWVYAEADDTETTMVYGQAQYTSAAGAEAEAPPTLLPSHIQEHAILIGRVLIKQGVDAPVQVDTAWETTFTASQAADHGNLSGLADDDHTQYLLADGTRALAGAWDMGSQNLTNVNIDSGVITGITDLLVADGGTGASTLTDHGVLLGSGTGAVTPLAEASDGQLIIGSTGNDPVLSTITAGGGIGIINASGSITVSATGGGIAWSVITGTTGAAVNNAYICNNAGTRVAVTLPDPAAVGSVIELVGRGAAGWRLNVNSGETIYIGDTSCTASTGYLASTDTGDCVRAVCIEADVSWRITSSFGNITVA